MANPRGSAPIAPSDASVRVLRVIARMNIGGPAYHVSLLSGLMAPPYQTVLATGRLGRGEGSLEWLADRYGARMVKVPGLGPELVPWRDLRAILALIRLVRRTRPDIVHTHTAKAGLIGRSAACFVRPRPIIVHTYHGHVLTGYFGPIMTSVFRGLERLMARVSDRLVTVSQATKDDLVRLRVAPAERFEVVPLGLDLDRFLGLDLERDGRLAAELNADDDEVVCTFVGRLVPIKRLDVLLDAAAILLRDRVRVRFAIVGDGELRERLVARAGELGLGDAVRFLGFRQDLDVIAAGTDIAVLSSDNEGTPVALIEAGAAGRPVVATDVGGVAEVVTPETGRLVQPGDPAALAAAVAELAREPELRLRLGAAGRARVSAIHDKRRLLEDVRQLYDRLRRERDAAR